MRRFAFLFAGFAGLNLAIALASPGCGNSVVEIIPGDGGGGAGGDTSSTGGTNITDGGVDAKDALPDYTDPGCPDAGPAMTAYECDAFDQGNGDCPEEYGCYIWVNYPEGACAQEIYGSSCAPQGNGEQGDGCGGGQDCEAGLVCVITGFGTQCVQLCPLTGESGCPSGLTCEAIDVEGFGGCF